MGNCSYCGSTILAHEPVGKCEACQVGFICEACSMQKYCKPCEDRWNAQVVAELAAMPPAPKPGEPSWKHMSGICREREIWDELGYGT